MRTLHVFATTEYDVCVSNGCLSECGSFIRRINRGSLALIVSDDTVWSLYGEQVSSSLSAEGYTVFSYTVLPGDTSKSVENWCSVLHALSVNIFSRNDVIIALGGGVVSDLAGFAAACYMRGIPWICIPTTLLSMADASIGGKTAINIPEGKNLVGAFCQPSGVIIDPDCLKSLPEREVSNGFAEVVKCAMLSGETLLSELRDGNYSMEDVIYRCLSYKQQLIAQDEFDTGVRQLLNFGHTLGHALETVSGYSLPHGYAVSIGMASVTQAAESAGICEKGTFRVLSDLLSRFGLPTAIPAVISLDELRRQIRRDKKHSGNTINAIIPVKAGECRVLPFASDEFCSFLGLGAAK